MTLIETARDVTKAVIVMVSATVSYVTSWLPSSEMLGVYDKVVSVTAGIVAIIVGLMTIYNYIRKWRAEPESE